MARRPRLELPGVAMHVIQRGNNRATCFVNDRDCRLYLRCLGTASRRHRCAIHAYVLMPNHVHLLVTPDAIGGVARMMQDVGRRYVRLFNDAHERSGTLWEGRYKSSLIDTERYFLTCHRYIELNPVRAKLVEHPADYPWSSHRHYANGNGDPLVSPHSVFQSLAGSGPDRQKIFRELFQNPIDGDEVQKIRVCANKGWALGSELFLDEIEKTAGRLVRPPKRGRPSKPVADPAQEMLI